MSQADLRYCITWTKSRQDKRAMPPPLHTAALGTDTWHSDCGSKTWRSTTLLLGWGFVVCKAHAVALDNGRRFRSLVLPAHQDPGEDDRGHCHSQQADARTVTDPVGRPELGLIDLWSLARCTVSCGRHLAVARQEGGFTHHDAHQLCHTLQGNSRVSDNSLSTGTLPCPPTHIGNPNRQPCAGRPTRRSDAFCSRGHGVSQSMHRGLGPGSSPGRGPCHTKLTWPDDWKETLSGRRGYHNKDILCCCVVDRDEQNVEDDLRSLEPNPCRPWAEPPRVGEVPQGEQYEEDGGICWLHAQSVDGSSPSLCVLLCSPWS